METISLPQSYFASIKSIKDLETLKANYTNVGYGKKSRSIEENIHTAVTVDHIGGKVNPSISTISRKARWNADELTRLTRMGASQSDINTMSEILPMRHLMENALHRGGYPVPPDITDLLQAFYQNIIKNSPVAKNFAYVEGNPILYQMKKQNHASAAVISSLVDLVPAATSYVNAAMSKSSDVNDPMIVKDATDIKAFINAKAQGLPTDNIVAGKTSLSPWIIGIAGIVVIVILIKWIN